MNIDALTKIGKDFGVPVAFCAVLCTAIWFTVSWTAQKVVEPLINSHVEYLKTEEADRKEMKTALIKQTDILKDIRDDQRKFPAVSSATP